MEEKSKQLSPAEYFEEIKSRKQLMTDDQLTAIYDNCLELISKYKITGQMNAIKKLMFHLDCIEKERELVKLGINIFVYKDDIEYYINNVADDIVKVIELERYERELPDEIVEVVANVKDKFDQLYIVFTDYTQEHVKSTEKERDPILFGVFKDESKSVLIDRFYFLGDWIDEYCDLTLDKMVNETLRVGKRKIDHLISTPTELEELKAQLKQYSGNITTINNTDIYTINSAPIEQPRKSFFSKIRTFFTVKK